MTAIALPGASRADIIGTEDDITYNGCGSSCGSLANNYGIVSIPGNTLTFDIDLAPSCNLRQITGATALQFSVSGATVTAANVKRVAE